MKNFLLPLILFSVFCFAQQNSLKQTTGIFPLYVVDGMIANEAQLKAFTSAEISSVSVYKSDNLPDKLSPFSNFSTEGIIDITLKNNSTLPTVLLYQMNMEHRLKESNAVYINRILVKSNHIKILKNAIIETEIIDDNGQQFLNIWTLTKEERSGIVKRTGGIKINPKDRSNIKNVILK
ncbi:MAG: hypothetical protein KUL76_08250 [Kaistella sp.]|nr:hypothetical protein [Kaistella sp.]